MWNFIAFVGFLGAIVYLVLAFIAIFKRNGKAKRNFGIVALCFVLFMVGAVNSPTSETANTEGKEEGKEKVTVTLNEYTEVVPLKQEEIELSGSVKNATKLSINNKDVNISEDGSFTTTISLIEGENEIKIVATKVKDGKGEGEKTKTINVLRANPLAKLELPEKEYSNQNDFELFGKTEGNAEVVVYKGNERIGTTIANENGYFTYMVVTKDEGEHTFSVEVSKKDYKSVKKDITIIRELSEEEELAVLKATAKTIEYKQLEKNPDRYAGEYVMYHGEIIQIMEGDGRTQIRLAVTKDSWGWNYDDVIFVEYNGYTDFVEEDIVTIYGEVFGSYSYTSQAGWEITLPAVIADIIE